MGYNTTYRGHFTISPPLTADQAAYLARFSQTRRVKRDEIACGHLSDPFRVSVCLPLGRDGAYFIGDQSTEGRRNNQRTVLCDEPPHGQPGVWCKWIPEDCDKLVWDGSEKFFEDCEWLRYLIEHFFLPWGLTLSGAVFCDGEEPGDVGVIVLDPCDGGTKIIKLQNGGRIEPQVLHTDDWAFHAGMALQGFIAGKSVMQGANGYDYAGAATHASRFADAMMAVMKARDDIPVAEAVEPCEEGPQECDNDVKADPVWARQAGFDMLLPGPNGENMRLAAITLYWPHDSDSAELYLGMYKVCDNPNRFEAHSLANACRLAFEGKE